MCADVLFIRAQSTIRADGPPSAQGWRKLSAKILELKEHVFVRLDELGLQARLACGEHLDDAQLVREWLELSAPARPQTPVASAINARQRR